MGPVLRLDLGDLHCRAVSYDLFMLLAAVATVALGLLVATRRGLPFPRVAACLLAMAAALPVGARLLHVVTNQGLYAREPARLLNLDSSGFSLYGGMFAAMVVGLVATRLLGLDVRRCADAVAPALGVGIATMRVGCYLAGCCFGQPADLPWAVRFPFGSESHLYQMATIPGRLLSGPLPVHPTQLYELAAALAGAVLALAILSRRGPDGAAFLAFVLWFNAFRLVNHSLRVAGPTLESPAWFYPALYLCFALLSGSLLLWPGLRARIRRAPARIIAPACMPDHRPAVPDARLQG